MPLLASAGGAAVAGFAAEVLRTAEGAQAYRIDGAAGRLFLGDRAVPLAPGADLRLRPTDPGRWADRTLPLLDLMDRPQAGAALAGRIVLIGLVAPGAAVLRPTAVTPLAPSVQIQADAIETLRAPHPPLRPAAAAPAEAAAAALLSLLAIAVAAARPPAAALAAALGLSAAWSAGAAALFLWRGFALDPAGPALAVLATALAAMLAGLIAARRRAAALRLRFERHLAPGVVARLAADPALLRLPVERRSVTALFTDLEGFTAAAVRLPPERLVAILDAYFGGLTAIVHAHGGMVDKFVGDAAHCLFNAPFDLPGHAARALDCALALRAWGEAFAADPAHAGLGRTRVGVETGPVVVGEVGSGTKLDYTAHGTAVNLAARLEQAAGPLGCGILAGPGARAADPDRAWQARGTLELKGLGPVEVHEPGPARPPGSATVRDGAA